jgi:hypothetical protein
MGGGEKSENNKELLGFVGERKKTRVNNEVSIMRCPTTWLGPPLVGGPLAGNVDSSAGTGIGLLKYPLVQVPYLKPHRFKEPPGPGTIWKKKKTPDSKERTTGSGSLQNFQRTSGCQEGPGKDPVGIFGYLILC